MVNAPVVEPVVADPPTDVAPEEDSAPSFSEQLQTSLTAFQASLRALGTSKTAVTEAEGDVQIAQTALHDAQAVRSAAMQSQGDAAEVANAARDGLVDILVQWEPGI